MSTDLKKLFNPRAVAVIGATQKEGRIGRVIFETLLGSERPIYPVHPNADMILGHKAYANIEDLPDTVDLALIAIGAAPSVEAAELCAKKGIPFIIPVAGGFGEVGDEGAALEARLAKIVEDTDSRILGPNTLGLHVPGTKLDTLFVEHGDEAMASGGGVAFITQSGSVGVEALGLESNIGYPLGAWVGLGNKVDLEEIEFIKYFDQDETINTLALYVESLSNARGFLEAAKEASAKKPVVVLKAGRTAAGAQAASSHTGKLAGSDRVVNGAFRQYGIQRVFDDVQLSDASRILSMVKPTSGNRVGILTAAGGFGVMACDHIESPTPFAKLQTATLLPETEARIREKVPAFAAVHNPVDLTAGADNEMYLHALECMLDDPGVDIALAIALFSPPGFTEAMIDGMAELASRHSKPIVVSAQFGPYTDKYLKRFYETGLAGFPSVERAVRAMRHLVDRAHIVENMGAEL